MWAAATSFHAIFNSLEPWLAYLVSTITFQGPVLVQLKQRTYRLAKEVRNRACTRPSHILLPCTALSTFSDQRCQTMRVGSWHIQRGLPGSAELGAWLADQLALADASSIRLNTHHYTLNTKVVPRRVKAEMRGASEHGTTVNSQYRCRALTDVCPVCVPPSCAARQRWLCLRLSRA